MKPYELLCGGIALAALCYGQAALAAPIGTGTSYVFTVNTAQTASGLPSMPYATVTLTQGVNQVAVDVKLASGFVFANTGVGPAFAFSLGDNFANAAINLSAATGKYFTAGTSSTYNLTPYGSFTDALLFKSGVGAGLSAGLDMPLDFSVAQSGISLDDFTTSTSRSGGPSTKLKLNGGQAGGYAFAIDLGYALTGKTGGVGQLGLDHKTDAPPDTPVPEPASLALLGLGLGGVAALRRKRHSASG